MAVYRPAAADASHFHVAPSGTLMRNEDSRALGSGTRAAARATPIDPPAWWIYDSVSHNFTQTSPNANFTQLHNFTEGGWRI